MFVELFNSDIVICQGESVQFFLEIFVNNIIWFKDIIMLLCDDCLDFLVIFIEIIEYVGLVDVVCYQDIVSVLVQVYDFDVGLDVMVC